MSAEPNEEELAAVLAVLAAAASAAASVAGPDENQDDDATTIWGTPSHTHRRVRATFNASSHGWRTSFWPR